ncbi:TRAP transporter small permease subunit [Maricaulis sp. MIT060901]|uniref:TRAP transporter small permease subunit n=1 Tax=Maricaulis sp. MIT060901 TaxID=3096993 RepID=UPI00399AD309
MRQGDGFLLVLVLVGIGLSIVDGMTGGGVAGWFQANLPGIAQSIGGKLALAARYLWPVLTLPLIMAVLGRFIALPSVWHGFQRSLIGLIETITGALGGAARWFALGLVVVTATIVVQRYVFGFASTKLQESVIYMHALLFLLASASTLLADGHVRVDIFYSKASERGKAWIDLLGVYLTLIPMSALILWASTGYMNSTWRILERSRESDGLPFVFLLKTAIPLFAVLMILQGIAMAARSGLKLAGQETPPRPKNLGEGEV